MIFCIALQGNRDGHNFILDAYKNGAKGFIVERSKKEKIINELITVKPEKKVYLILTDNTLNFLQNAAKYQRKQFKGAVIGVLGSNGKTSTKDFLYQSIKLIENETYATSGNWNNHIGLPLVLLNMPENTKILILELGMNHPGEIELLSNISRPDIAIITSIGREHMEFFSSLEEVAKAELEVLKYFDSHNTLYYPYNAPLQEWIKEQTLLKEFQTNFFYLIYNNNTEIKSIQNSKIQYYFGKLNQDEIHWKHYKIKNQNLKHIGLYNNLFLTLLVLHNHFFESLDPDFKHSILKELSNLKPISKQRFEFIKVNNVIIIDDSYNANPDSFISAIDSIKHLFSKNFKIGCFAGHMAELGHYSKEGHLLIGEYLAKNHIDLIAVCGNPDVQYMIEGYKKFYSNIDIPYFENSEILANNLLDLNLPLNQYQIILIKGSRSAKMELITYKLKEVLQNV
ncbi:MAG: UDP-N-acetylmuramoyl-tripeptide--D-alanyl-D-alanine ligase [Leptospiraceae bacterium]|nr:MAG: UDP-N-acetylmuramoyl-tripeptide--D-alanyl-D-alanine ligase [Leptospiraceae bacterium]